jgi:hypothetical protein
MPLAMSLIVDGYVRLRDRDALEKLRVHRITMLEAAKSVAELDNSRMLATLEEEIELISAGLSGVERRAGRAKARARRRSGDFSDDP